MRLEFPVSSRQDGRPARGCPRKGCRSERLLLPKIRQPLLQREACGYQALPISSRQLPHRESRRKPPHWEPYPDATPATAAAHRIVALRSSPADCRQRPFEPPCPGFSANRRPHGDNRALEERETCAAKRPDLPRKLPACDTFRPLLRPAFGRRWLSPSKLIYRDEGGVPGIRPCGSASPPLVHSPPAQSESPEHACCRRWPL